MSNKKGKSKYYALENVRHYIISIFEEQGRDFNVCEQCGKIMDDNEFVFHHTKYSGATIYDLQIVCVKCNAAPRNKYLV